MRLPAAAWRRSEPVMRPAEGSRVPMPAGPFKGGRATREVNMKAVLIAGVLIAGLSNAYADGTCTANATDKKLAGAAKTSFMTKCQKDAAASCDATAATKKLAGAAKTSFTTKCLKDAVGG